MTRLRYLTDSSVNSLRAEVKEKLDWYYRPSGALVPPSNDYFREASFETPPLAPILEMGGEHDALNSMAVFNALRNLTPQQASDERLWAYVSHFDAYEYVANRWLSSRPSDIGKAVRKAHGHFFARDSRGLIRDHGVSRLWWLGKIAHDVDRDDAGLFLEIVLHRQDVRSQLIERPSLTMNREVLRGIYAVMKEHWVRDRKLFEREVFRSWMARLNRRGGIVLLDALPNGPLEELLREEADRALKES